MLSLIKSKTKKDGIRTVVAGAKRSKSLISRPSSEVKQPPVVVDSGFVEESENLQNQQIVVNSSGETVLLHSSGGPSFGFTAMEIQRPSSVMMHQSERPSSRSSNSSSRR